MSHTSYCVVDEVEYTIIHNGDWSGDATIWGPDRTSNSLPVAVLPGRLLRVMGRRAALEEAVSAIESLM
jgi:hypothetical protein